ncbi:carbohydrate ABC transporter membrane protein 1, CUT1 family (TC 3.A.1.1.-) [Paenibacillus sp. yr247]|uniref:ABC transporter permease n=1 Tax=Paenibacillus sp. yr247 TaxID=1761880 RepID=UPI0008856DC7|nr:ABC transporter permease subunit [Paenibacillus sp. yr247]SDM80986.1 carbohydrate ABC transporter membrane protein 1, CUT1 family (TC 3.A.1.1.-) [Paenibacillus sp. yr247]
MNQQTTQTLVKRRLASKSIAILQDWDLYLLAIPGVLYFVIFKYLPMWGVLLSFEDYSPFLGFWESPWVGFKHFITLFTYEHFWELLRNTLLISFYQLLFFFPVPIILALLLNEVRYLVFKKLVQSVIYLPHFISWVVIASMTYVLLSGGGVVNHLIQASGGHTINFLSAPEMFRILIVSQDIWKEAGWGTIIYLAALSSVDPMLYEAAVVDGANRWQQMWHITLPSIRSTIIILLLLRLGHVLDVGFEQIFLMLNTLVQNVGDVFETFVYTKGLVGGQFSFASAVGLFKSVISLIIVAGANWLTKKSGEEGIY